MAKKGDMEYMHDILVKVDSRLDDVEIILAKQEENLKLHMKRSDQLESIVSGVQKHVHMVQGVGAFLGLLALIATVVAALR